MAIPHYHTLHVHSHRNCLANYYPDALDSFVNGVAANNGAAVNKAAAKLVAAADN